MKQFLLLFISLITINSFGQIVHKRKLSMLGSPFEITVVAKDTIQGNYFIGNKSK